MIDRGFHGFVALRYVSNTRGRWSIVLGGVIAVMLTLGLLTLVTGALCFDVVQQGSLTRKVALAIPTGGMLLAGWVAVAALVTYVLLRFSQLPRVLAVGAGVLLAAGGVIDFVKPTPAWDVLIAPGGGGATSWTMAAAVPSALAVLIALVGLFSRTPRVLQLEPMPHRRMPSDGAHLGAAVVFGGARLSLMNDLVGMVSTRGFASVMSRFVVVLMGLGLLATQVLASVLERVDVAEPPFAAYAAYRDLTISIIAGLTLLMTIALVIYEWGHARRIAATVLTLLGAGGAGLLLTWAAMSRGLIYPDVFVAKATGLRFFAEAPTVDLAAMAGLRAISVGGFLAAGLLFVLFVVSRLMSFYSTVSIGGVWIGTMALVVVLSVMGGFEADLREKILGSNAHIQITRDEGDFTDWRAVRARIDAVQGVKASTPFATSEVVIASNNNYFNVIIKGIDTSSVAAVTDLVRDLDDPDAMQRLDPIVVDDLDLGVPQGQARPAGTLDPAPDDLPDGAEPIDFSAPPDARPASSDATEAAAAPPREPVDAIAFDDAIGRKPTVADAPAGNGAQATMAPTRMATEGAIDLPTVDITATLPRQRSNASRRTQTLNGILVGRELTKQIHLQPGQDVRLISPLSDPSNPDATGTPIPFNRDYRVAGVFYTGMYEYDLKYVYVKLASLQSFLDRGDTIDGIEVRIGDPDGTGPVVAALQRELGPAYRVQDWRELNRNLFSALKLEKIAMFLVLGIIILVASFSIVGNLIMVVIEKGREIALLKTLGASTRDVVILFVLQGLLIGVTGTVLGVVSGLGMCWYLATHGFPINPDVYYIDKLPLHVDYGAVAMIGAAGLVISVAATLYPAILASRLRPAAGLRT